MKHSLLLAAVAVAAMHCAPVVRAADVAPPAASAGIATGAALAGFDAFIARVMRDWRVPGLSIAIVRDGKVVLARGYGVRDLATGAPMDEHTLFPIQSETKAFTAFTVGLAVDEGKLSWDAPVSTYIPGFRLSDPIASDQVNLRDLLAHRSGLPSHGWLWLTNTQLTRRDAMTRYPHLPMAAPLRTTWQYANLGYVAAAQAVENVAGVAWETQVEQRILRPLGMTRTTFDAAQANADGNHISGSMWRDGRDISTPMQGTTPMTYSTGGLYSTAIDMSRWLRLQLDGGELGGERLIREDTLAEMHRPQMIIDRPMPSPELVDLGYGLGWFIETYRGEKLVQHGGGHWGVTSIAGMLPGRGLGISIFANQETDLPLYLMLQIFDRFTGKGRRDWVAEMLPEKLAAEAEQTERERQRERGRVATAPASHPLADYAGAYVHPGFGAVDIAVEGETLVARASGDRSPLEHWHFDVFAPTATQYGNIWAMLPGLRVQFLLDYDGKVSALRISATVEGVVFKKHIKAP